MKPDYERIVEYANEYIVIVQDDRIRFMNRKARSLPCFAGRDLTGVAFSSYIHPDDRTTVFENLKRRLGGEDLPPISRFRVTDDAGRTYWVENNAVLIEWDARPAVLNFLTDITEQMRMEESLRSSERRYREFLEEIEDGYFEVDLSGTFVFYNRAMCTIVGCGHEELLGRNYRDFMSSSTAQKVFDAFHHVYESGGPAKGQVWELTRRDGSPRFVETSLTLMRDERGFPKGFKGIARDITSQKQLEVQLLQMQKMEALGTLAGGIAHDFNNILSGILGYAELALLDMDGGSQSALRIEQIVGACHRARSLVNQILAFSRRGESEAKPVSIRYEVEEALRMLRASIPSTIEIRTSLGADDAVVKADPTQIHQIVVNLCTNAYHAVRDGGGSIEVRLSSQQVGEGDKVHVLGLKPGRYVELVVADTGCGMAQDIVQRIFDPYFTTKPKGEGTGLGLAIVQAIVRDLEGAVKVHSAPGRGSSFHVWLPAFVEIMRRPKVERFDMPRGTESVLVIDDEQSIVDITSHMLRRLGYRVTSCMSSMEALELFRKGHGVYDIVITDLTMPSMNGDRLAQEMLSIRPGIPIILCTGFTDEVTKDGARRAGIREVLTKPVTMETLARTVRKVLDQDAA